jgi:quercetin dioxygenase-like cupin family protein
MKHVHYDEIEAQEVDLPGAQGVRIRWLVSESDGAPTFYMRRFELAPGGRTPLHAHEWEHEVYILEGEGTVLGADGEERFRAGDVVFMPGGEEHYFAADQSAPVAFLCLIPSTGK